MKKLQKAHKSGVTVLFLLNSIKDLRVKKLDFYVADFGNKNKFQYINIVQHSKFLLTDEIGFVFSGNFWRRVNPTDKTLPKTGQERPTTNIGCKITGDLVHDLFLLFDILWRNSKVLLGNTQNSYIALKEIKIYLEHLPKTKNHSENILGRVVFRGEGSSFFNLEKQLLNAFSLAKKEILIVTPYPVFPLVFVRLLIATLNRGVSVKIITPKYIDQGSLSKSVLNSSVEWLLRLGIEVHYNIGFFDHSKVIIIDDYWLTLGSSNFDKRSTYISYETNLEIWNQKIANQIKNHIKSHKLEEVKLNIFQNNFFSQNLEDFFLLYSIICIN